MVFAGMRPHGIECRLAALFVSLALVAGPSRVRAAELRLSGVPPRVLAGERVHVAWSGLSSRAHEVELELSLAGGRWVRISPELDAREGRYSWRVPASFAGPARIRLRCGGDGFEDASEGTAEFVIVADPRASHAPGATFDDGDWWTLGRRGGAVPLEGLARPASLGSSEPLHAVAPNPVRWARTSAPLAACIEARARWGAACEPRGVSNARTARYPLRI